MASGVSFGGVYMLGVCVFVLMCFCCVCVCDSVHVWCLYVCVCLCIVCMLYCAPFALLYTQLFLRAGQDDTQVDCEGIGRLAIVGTDGSGVVSDLTVRNGSAFPDYGGAVDVQSGVSVQVAQFACCPHMYTGTLCTNTFTRVHPSTHALRARTHTHTYTLHTHYT